MSNFLWVLKQYYAHKKLFDDYKLGQISDAEFLESLLKVLPFLKNNKKIPNPEALLQEAWNDFITWDDQSTVRLKQVVELSQCGDPVYLISNTNPMHIDKILSLFHANYPELKLNMDAVKTAPNNTPIEIAPNIYLCLSYKYGLYKEGTPGLLGKIAKDIDVSRSIVISQYGKDLEIAKSLNIPTLTADHFYPEVSQLKFSR
jgi:hypothetical protein